MAPGRPSWRSRAEWIGRWAENLLLTVLLVGLILLASAQILLRNVFSFGWPWADGLIRLMVLWLALLGAVAASRERRHIAIDLAGRFLPPGARRAARLVVDVFVAAFTAAMAWYSWTFVRDSREFGDIIVVDWPAWIFQLVMPAAFALIAYRYLVHFVSDLRGR